MKPTDEVQLKKFRTLLIERVEREDPDKTAELALSGGIDSATALFAMLESGRRPKCFTFYIDGSPSDDLLSSRAICKHFGLELREVKIEWNVEKLFHDLKTRILPAVHNPRKPTIVQCLHPWFYMYPVMESDIAFCGLGAEVQYCALGRMQKMLNTAAAAAKRNGMSKEQAQKEADKVLWSEGWRGTSWENDLNESSGNIMRLGRTMGKRLIDIYSGDQNIIDWFCQFSAFDLNKPFPKAASVMAFFDYFNAGNFLRKPSYYQINSGLQALHEALLDDPRFNTRESKAVVSVYLDIVNGKL